MVKKYHNCAIIKKSLKISEICIVMKKILQAWSHCHVLWHSYVNEKGWEHWVDLYHVKRLEITRRAQASASRHLKKKNWNIFVSRIWSGSFPRFNRFFPLLRSYPYKKIRKNCALLLKLLWTQTDGYIQKHDLNKTCDGPAPDFDDSYLFIWGLRSLSTLNRWYYNR